MNKLSVPKRRDKCKKAACETAKSVQSPKQDLFTVNKISKAVTVWFTVVNSSLNHNLGFSKLKYFLTISVRKDTYFNLIYKTKISNLSGSV